MIIKMYRLPFTVSLNTKWGKKGGAMMIMVSFLGSCISEEMLFNFMHGGCTCKNHFLHVGEYRFSKLIYGGSK